MDMSWLSEMKTPVATISPVLDPELEIMQRRVLALYEAQRAYLAAKPTAFLEELQQRSEERQDASTFTLRVAAVVNHAACTLILEARKGAQL